MIFVKRLALLSTDGCAFCRIAALSFPMEKNALEHRPPAHYSAVAQTIHWLTALLVLVAFVYGPGGSEERVYSAARNFDRQIHESLGMGVFALLVVRVVWRLFDTRPAPEPMPRWMVLASKAVQGLLYLLLFAVPMTAILGAWLEGHPLTLLAGIEIAPVVGESRALGGKLAELHTWLGDVILWLAGFHALAALYHHVVIGDRVFASMLPGWASPQEPGER